ncbi:MAG: transketolase [Blautia sp.]|nr:transketolase [Blautia sp.]
MRTTFINTLTELSRKDDKVMCVIGDTGFSVFEQYEKEFPERFINVGIAEQNFVSFGAGLAAMGMKPFIYNVVSFMVYRAWEQIELDVCYQENPVVLVGVGGGHAYGTAGPTHHGYFDIALMRELPNMMVFCPADPVEMRAVMYAVYEANRPAYIRIGRSADPVIHQSPVSFEIGKVIPMREGKDTILLSTGTMVKDALRTADLLEEQGAACAVYSVPSIEPMDVEFIEQLQGKYSCIYTLEEHSIRGGLGSAVEEVLSEKDMREIRLHKFGFPRTFAPVTGSREYLNALYGLDSENVAKVILKDLQSGV